MGGLEHGLPGLADDLAFPGIGVDVERIAHLLVDGVGQLGWCCRLACQPMVGAQGVPDLDPGQGADMPYTPGTLPLTG